MLVERPDGATEHYEGESGGERLVRRQWPLRVEHFAGRRGSEELVRSEHVATASSAQQTSACVVCLSGDSTHALVPCGHVCVCGTCLGAVVGRERRCPMCRATVDSSMRVYLCL